MKVLAFSLFLARNFRGVLLIQKNDECKVFVALDVCVENNISIVEERF